MPKETVQFSGINRALVWSCVGGDQASFGGHLLQDSRRQRGGDSTSLTGRKRSAILNNPSFQSPEAPSFSASFPRIHPQIRLRQKY